MPYRICHLPCLHSWRNEQSQEFGGESNNSIAVARMATVLDKGHDGKKTRDVRKYAAKLGIAEEEALKAGMEEKSTEFVEGGTEVYKQV